MLEGRSVSWSGRSAEVLGGTGKSGADRYIKNQCLEASKPNEKKTLPRDVVGTPDCPVTVLSWKLKESEFVMVVPRTMLKLPSTKM